MDYPRYLEWLMASKAPEFLGLVLTRLRPCSKAKAQVPPGPPVKSTKDGGILGRKRWWKVKKNGKKTSFERIKMDFPADWIEKIGECSRNGFEPICFYEFTIVFPIFGRKSQARHQQYRESPMQEMPGTQWVKTFGTPFLWYPKIVG